MTQNITNSEQFNMNKMMCVASFVVFCLTDLDNGKIYHLSLHTFVNFSQFTTCYSNSIWGFMSS